MKRLVIPFLVICVGLCFDASAQSRKKKERKSSMPAAGYSQLPSSLNPNSTEKRQNAEPKKRRETRKPTYDQQQQYYDRVVAVAKAREKAAREMEKPQYSDPSYFGHKRKPKKRPPHKMKFCKECGIRH